MDRQHESEVVAAGVRLDDRLGRAVPFNRTEDGRITGVARLCEFEFLEEFPDAPVSVLLSEEAKLFQVSFLFTTHVSPPPSRLRHRQSVS